MTDEPGSPASQGRNTLFRSLANEKRRIVLGRLLARSPAPVSIDDLVDHLAAVTADETGDPDPQRAKIALHHDVLPALADADLVEIDDESDTLELTDEPRIDDDVVELLTDRERVTDEALSAVFAALADPRRRLVCSKLRRSNRPLDVRNLARSVAAAEDQTPSRSVPSDCVDDVKLSLVHVHLPKLAEAGLVTYDESSGRTEYLGHPDLRVDWVTSSADTLPVRAA